VSDGDKSSSELSVLNSLMQLKS